MIKGNIEKQIFFNKYKLQKLINKSEFSYVYQGINLIDKELVAIKIENRIANDNILESEAYILFYLKGFGIPNLISYGKSGKYNILVEEFLGPSLHQISQKKVIKNGFPLKDVCMIALQGLDRLEYIHSKNIIHRDIKLHNFLIGRKDEKIIYLIDFGFARKYKSSRTGKFIKFKNLKKVFGSLAFSSINANSGYEQSRRDDLESFGYMIIYLVKNTLPWLKAGKIKNKIAKLVESYKLKNSSKLEKICEGLPEEFIDYIKYCRNLEFEQYPNYDYLRNLFVTILIKENQKNDLKFFWIKKKVTKSETKNYENNSIKKRDIHKRLYNSIKKSLEKKRKESNNSILKLDNSKTNASLNKVNNIQKKKNEAQIQKLNLLNGHSEKKRLINSKVQISIKNYKTDKNIISEKNLAEPIIYTQKYNTCLKNQKLNNLIKRNVLNYNSKNHLEKPKIKKMLKISDNIGLHNYFNIYNQNINNTMNGNNYFNFEDSIYNKIKSRNVICNHNLDFNKNGNQTPSNNSCYNLIPDIHYKLKFKNISTPDNKSRFGKYSLYSYRTYEKNNTFQGL